MGVRDLLYRAYERRLARPRPRPDPAPRRGHARRQPPLGQGSRRQHRARAPGRRRQDRRSCSAGARRSASRSSPCGCCRPTTSTAPGRGAAAAAAGSSRTSSTSLAADAALADPPRRRARPAARRDRRAPQGGRGAPPRDVDGLLVNVAVGYGGRREIADAVRSLLHGARRPRAPRSRSSPRSLDVEHIAEHLYTKGQPDPDLVIRTSGEQRLGGFLLWQSAHSEFYFCEAYWPDFRRVDFLRALRAYAAARAPLRRLTVTCRHRRGRVVRTAASSAYRRGTDGARRHWEARRGATRSRGGSAVAGPALRPGATGACGSRAERGARAGRRRVARAATPQDQTPRGRHGVRRAPTSSTPRCCCPTPGAAAASPSTRSCSRSS